MHWAAQAKAKKQVGETVEWLARRAGIKDLRSSVVSVTWFAPDRRKRDSDSLGPFLKASLDGLVAAGVWPDDHSDYVKQTRMAIDKTDTKNPRIEIRIWEVGETGIERVA
jgi:crossover junction endodeoxyribonuclease RusA